MAIKIINEDLNLSRAIDCEDYLEVTINDKVYQYKPTTGFTVEELVDKFNEIKKHSSGRALQWLKKNAKGTRVVPVTESINNDEAKKLSNFIMNNTSHDNVDNLNMGEKSAEIISERLGNYINYFTSDDTGMNSYEFSALLDINDEDNCLWYDYFVDQIYKDEYEEVILIECGEYDLILTITDGFYYALNFNCSKEQLIGAIMSTQKLEEGLFSNSNKIDSYLNSNCDAIIEFIKTDFKKMSQKIFQNAVIEYNKFEYAVSNKILNYKQGHDTDKIKSISKEWNNSKVLKKFQNKIDDISSKMRSGYGDVGKYLSEIARRYRNLVKDFVGETKYY